MAEYQFNPVEARDRLVEKIREFMHGVGVSRVALGVSGGKDSTVASALCARALRLRTQRGQCLYCGADGAGAMLCLSCLGKVRQKL